MRELNEIGMFGSLGYSAGMVEKSAWEAQDRIYDHIRDNGYGRKRDIVIPRQTHSAEIAFVDDNSLSDGVLADGLLSESADICLTVRTADCIPLIFAEPSGLFGIVHIGWRGFAAGILDELFLEVRKKGFSAENSNVYLGPSIGPCCFEVGGEVAALFADDFLEEREGRYYIDLPQAARNIISAYGVKESNVEISSECTFCEKDRFYSYRRDGSAPIQMVSYIYKKENS